MAFSVKSYGTACSPSTTSNGACSGAIALTPNAACVTSNTCGGSGAQATQYIPAGYGQCSWHSFVATTPDMTVTIDVTNSGVCYPRTAVFNSDGGPCGGGTEISSMYGSPYDDVHVLGGLVVGDLYWVMVCESSTGGCGGDEVDYCIDVADHTPSHSCGSCSSVCGVAQGYPTSPTVAQVVADCTSPDFSPLLQPFSYNNFCNSFVANNTSVSFNVIITSNCGAGNVTNFSWALYNSPSCGAAIQTGDLSSLTFTGLTIGNSYVYCYAFDVPAGCTHTTHCPFFIGAAPLPVELLSFSAEVIDNAFINLDWITKTEINNDFFTIEKSKDAKTFEVVGTTDGAGNSSLTQNYNLRDKNPYEGTSYYRLKQTDYDGSSEYSKMVAVEVKASISDVLVFPNPVEGLAYLSFSTTSEGVASVTIYDVSGRLVSVKDYSINQGHNKITLNTEELNQGMYFLTINNGESNTAMKFTKE